MRARGCTDGEERKKNGEEHGEERRRWFGVRSLRRHRSVRLWPHGDVGDGGTSRVRLRSHDSEAGAATSRSLSTAEIREAESDRLPFRSRRALKLSLLDDL